MKQVALITGGSRGIGFGIAKQLAGVGYDLAINGVRDAMAVQENLQELEAAGAKVLYCQANIADADARKQMLKQVRDFFGRLDIYLVIMIVHHLAEVGGEFFYSRNLRKFTQLVFITPHKYGIGHDKFAVASFYSTLINNFCNGSQQVLVRAHSACYAIHDDACLMNCCSHFFNYDLVKYALTIRLKYLS